MLQKGSLVFLFLVFSMAFNGIGQPDIQGIVFLDNNKNGVQDANEPGIENVLVSNGRDVVRTSKTGNWKLDADPKAEQIFVIKPSGYQVPVSSYQTPLYYSGTSNQNIEFPLYKQDESNSFSVVYFGDTQARGTKEMDYIFHDAVEELIGTDAAFGVSLGDIVADDPEMMDDVASGIAQIGIPWYNIFGNHDNDRNADVNSGRDNTFEEFFGPSTYAYEYGQVAFIALNNIYFQENGKYKPHFTERQLKFVANYLSHISEDKLIVLMMHAPIVACDNREDLYRIIEGRKHTFSISGHVHEQLNLFVDAENGWNGSEAHHHLINATVCGSWWCGIKDEIGIPHATMNDGAPNGYSIITFNGNEYEVVFKASRRPADYQMNIYFPDELQIAELDTTKVLVNVFAGSEKSVVEMKLDGDNNWITLAKKDQIDPQSLKVHQLNSVLSEEIDGDALEDIIGYKMDYPSVSTHMWEGKITENLQPGTHKITVRTTDMYGQSWIAHRIFRLTQ